MLLEKLNDYSKINFRFLSYVVVAVSFFLKISFFPAFSPSLLVSFFFFGVEFWWRSSSSSESREQQCSSCSESWQCSSSSESREQQWSSCSESWQCSSCSALFQLFESLCSSYYRNQRWLVVCMQDWPSIILQLNKKLH